ncbi:hypothetical protein Hanom_Chr03g00248261 [Helianthus anomalus]
MNLYRHKTRTIECKSGTYMHLPQQVADEEVAHQKTNHICYNPQQDLITAQILQPSYTSSAQRSATTLLVPRPADK